MAAEDVVGQLEEEAKRRRERLRALKQKLEGTEEDESNDKKIDKPLPKYKILQFIIYEKFWSLPMRLVL